MTRLCICCGSAIDGIRNEGRIGLFFQEVVDVH